MKQKRDNQNKLNVMFQSRLCFSAYFLGCVFCFFYFSLFMQFFNYDNWHIYNSGGRVKVWRTGIGWNLY